MNPLFLSLCFGYLPVLAVLLVLCVWYNLPVWSVFLGVFFGGAILTLLVAALRSAPDLLRRWKWRRVAKAQKTAEKAEGSQGSRHPQ